MPRGRQIVRFLKLSAGLLCMLALSATARSHALFNDFENGQVPHDVRQFPNENMRSRNNIPPTIVTESNGNHFLRMTAVPQDCGPIFATACPRTRAEIMKGNAPE